MKNRASRSENRSYLFKFWAHPFRSAILSYLLVILISVMVYLVMYSYAFSSMKQYAIVSGIKGHEHGMDLIESKVRDLNSLLNQIDSERGLRTFINVKPPLTGNDYDNLYNLRHVIDSYRVHNSDIEDIVLYYGRSDVFISTTTASSRTEDVYEVALGYFDPDFSEWKQYMKSIGVYGHLGPAMRKTVAGSVQSIIPYVRKYPLDMIVDSQSLVMITLDESFFREIMRNMILPGSGASYILDDQQNVLISYSDQDQESLSLDVNKLNAIDRYSQISIHNRQYLIVKTHSQDLKLTFVSQINLDSMMHDVTRLQAAFKFVLLFALIIEIVISILFALWNSRPISELSIWVKDLFQQNATQEIAVVGNYDLIRESISYLYDHSIELKTSLDRQVAMTSTVRLRQLLGIKYNTDDYTFEDKVLIPFSADTEGYVVVVINIFRYRSDETSSTQELNQIQKLITGLVDKIFEKQITNIAYDKNKIALIVETGSQTDEDDFIKKLNHLIKILEEQYEVGVSAGIGTRVIQTAWIRHSFAEAEHALQYGDLAGKVIMAYDQIPLTSDHFVYSIETQYKLLHRIHAGQEDEARMLIHDIYQENVRTIAVPEHMNDLLNAIYRTLIKASQNAAYRDSVRMQELRHLLNEIEHKDSIAQQYTAIQSAVQFMCEEIRNQNRSSGYALARQMTYFVEQNYMNIDLCLDTLADHFNLSAKYLSQLFKRQTGINFVEYVNNVRLEKAGALLQSSSTEIAQIFVLCGYANINTFYKAFKRHFDMSPGNYRDQYGTMSK